MYLKMEKMKRNKSFIANSNRHKNKQTTKTEVVCPNCHIGLMHLEPEYKHEGVYDVWTCEICEQMEIDYDLD